MVLTTPLSLNSNQTPHFSTPKTRPHIHKPIKPTQKLNLSNKMGRRKLSSSSLIITTSFALLLSTNESAAKAAEAPPGPFDFLRITVPDQTMEEAVDVVREHAQRLLEVKELLEMEAWKDAQKELRSSSAELRQDVYTIIQGKPGIERPPLRELYTKLFDSVTDLDFAARDKDVTRVRQCYGGIVDAINELLSRI